MTATAIDFAGTTSEFSSPVAYSVTATGLTFAATANVPFAGTVASFTSSDSLATAADFSATIDYGDGTSAHGTVVAAPAGFIVLGSHTFQSASPATPVTVKIVDELGFSQATANSLAGVSSSGGVIAPFGQSVTFVAGTQSSAVVASFTDSSPLAVRGEFNATVDWGDGTSSTGVVSADAAGFDVTGTHMYTASENYTISVSINDAVAPGAAPAQAGGMATVTSPSYLLSATGSTLAATTLVPFDGTLATFTTNAPSSTSADFSAAINYGDGTSALARSWQRRAGLLSRVLTRSQAPTRSTRSR